MFHSWTCAPATEDKDGEKRRVRARTGCLTCRKRRIKCDETHPRCQRCARSKLSCSYKFQLSWEDEALSKGKCHGRAGVWSKKDPKATDEVTPPLSSSSMSDHSLDDPKTKYSSTMPEVRVGGDALGADVVPEHSGRQVMNFNDIAFRSPGQSSTAAQNQALRPPARRSLWNIYLDNNTGVEEECAADSGADAALRPMAPLSIHPGARKFKHLENVLLSFYEQQIIPTVTLPLLDDVLHNPCRSTLLPMSFSSELTYYGVLMTTARAMSRKDPSMDVVELHYHHILLKRLRSLLSSGSWSWEDIMVPIVQICSRQISLSNGLSWIGQLTCYRDMALQQLRGTKTTRQNPLVHKFFSQYFAPHIVLSKTAFPVEESVHELCTSKSSLSRGGPSLDDARPTWTSNKAISLLLNSDSPDEIDSWYGFSTTLLLLINEIADLKYSILQLRTKVLATERNRDSPDDKKAGHEAIRDRILRLKSRLINLKQDITPDISQVNNKPPPVLSRHFHDVRSHGEAYRLAALLFLNEASTPKFVGFDLADTLSSPSLCVLTVEDCRYTIQAVLAIVRDIILQPHISVSWPLWPLFIAGCCSKEEEDRAEVMSIFNHAQSRVWFENIAHAQTVVELVWKAQTLRADPSSEEDADVMGKTPCHSWEKVLGQLGWKLSLA